MNGLNGMHFRTIAAILLGLCVLAPVTYGAPTPLDNGVPVTGLSGAGGSQVYYVIDVPSGQDLLEISISGGTGDCDLYVRHGSEPTLTSYDYRPYLTGNDETVSIETPAAGQWYVMLRGYLAYTNMTLTATYSASTVINPLTNGVPVTGLSGAQGTELYYTIEVPSGSSALEIITSGGTGDCDLYVKYGALPTTSDYDYRPFEFGNDETVSVETPTEGTWYIMLHGYSAYTGVTLVATYSGTTATELEQGVPVTGLDGSSGAEDYYRIEVPSGQTTLEISIAGGTGNCNLYVKYGSMPTTADWDYRPYESDNDETVTVDNPDAGTWYIMLQAPKSYSNVTLLADYWISSTTTVLGNGVPVSGLSGDEGDELYYVISVPEDQDTLQITITGGAGDADLYVKLGDIPTVGDYDYRPFIDGNEEEVLIEDPSAGDWYIMVRAFDDFAGVTLEASYESEGSEGPIELTNGVPVTGIAGLAYSEQFFMIEVPANQLELEVSMSGGIGDADLYIRKDDLPTVSEWDYRPYVVGNNESVLIESPEAGIYYIMVRGFNTYSGVSLVATYIPQEEGTVELTNAVPVTGISGASASERMYMIEVPADQNYVDISITGGSGNCDLYVRVGAEPTTSSWDYRPYLSGNDETVYVENPTPAIWYIMLRGRTAYSGVTLTAKYGVFGAGNRFVDDPNCVALWTFEEETLDQDVLSTNHLENEGVTVRLDDFKEGAGCADFEANQQDYMYIQDEDLAEGFPSKSAGGMDFQMSMCFWMKLESNAYLPTMISKYMTISDDRSWRFWVNYDYLELSMGYDGGDDFYSYVVDDTEQPMQTGTWYHVAFTYDEADMSFHVRIWDDTAGALRYDIKSQAFEPMAVTKAPLVFGNVLLKSWYFDGLLDEVVVFKDVLTDDEIDQIRQGAYMNPVSETEGESGSGSKSSK